MHVKFLCDKKSHIVAKAHKKAVYTYYVVVGKIILLSSLNTKLYNMISLKRLNITKSYGFKY